MDETQVKFIFGKHIKEIRKSKNLTQEKLAELVGMDTQHLCKMENGSHFPKLKNIIKLCSVLNIEIKDLFYNDNNSSHSNILNMINIELNKLNFEEIQFIYNFIKSFSELRNQ